MGNTDSKAPNVGKEGTVDHKRLGPVLVLDITDAGNQKVEQMVVNVPLESQKLFNEWQQQVSRMVDSETKQVLLVPEKQQFFKMGNLCSSSGFAKLTFQNFAYVLDTQIQNRHKMSKTFLDTEIWYLLYNFICAGNKFQMQKKKVGDMHPHNVLINDEGQIKVISSVSLPNELDNFTKVINSIHEKVYLAPEELNEDAIHKGQYPEGIDQCKAEVFSIGLTVLSSGILMDCQSIYDEGYKKMDLKRLAEFKAKFKQTYITNNYLCSIVFSMLQTDPKQRRKASAIHSELLPFESQILQLQNFQDRLNQNNNQNRGSRVQNVPIQYGQPQQPNIYYAGQGPYTHSHQPQRVNYSQPERFTRINDNQYQY